MDEDEDDLDCISQEMMDYLYGCGPKPNKKNGNENMEKMYYTTKPNCMEYKTYEEAEKAAKQYVARNHTDYVVLKAVALCNTPTPDVAVTKL